MPTPAGVVVGTKTSQLQIRISPAQKAALKSLAHEAGLSVSAYVLSRALPSVKLDFDRRVGALTGGPGRAAALSELASHLRGLPDEHFREAVAGVVPIHLSGLLQNYAAATVEREALRRGVTPPEWTARVEPLPTPHFASDLRSLRPHLMRVTAAAFKRRRVFAGAPATGPVGGREHRTRKAEPGDTTTETGPEVLAWTLRRWALLGDALGEEGVAAELCAVGGAVMHLAFAAEPGTRRPSALFASPDAVDRAAGRVAREAGLPSDWLNPAVREFVGTSPDSAVAYEGENLRVFAAPPDYVLAMTCASLEFAPATSTEGDIRYLLRFLELRSASRAMEVIDRYLNPRQRSDDLEARLGRLLS